MATTRGPAGARAYASDGVLLFAPRMPRTLPHACCAATVLVGLDGRLNLRGPDCTGREEAVVLAPNARHANAPTGRALVLLVDPDDQAYRFIHPVLGGATVRELGPDTAQALRREAVALLLQGRQRHLAGEFAERMLARLCPQPLPSLPWDPRLLRACRYLRTGLPHVMPCSADLAAAVGLSQSRFLHLFQAQLGMALRKYRLWLRVRCALALREERTLAGVALGSGFYDQAHFTRTIRSMTGHAPSMFFAHASVAGAGRGGGPTASKREALSP